MDLSEQKPYGPNKGQYWDLSLDCDLQELKEMVEFEDPWLITGSPPCDPFSQLQHLSKHKGDPADRAAKRVLGEKHLHNSIHFYRRQLKNKRYFLHEHPVGADSFQDPKMVALMNEPGVEVVEGPMCRWDLRVFVHNKVRAWFTRKHDG